MSKFLMLNLTRFLTVAILCFAASTAGVLAQSTVTGGIRGTITDPQSAVLPNVAVTVTNAGTNQTQTVTTDENGVYVASNLQPGTYTINITQTGFAPFTGNNVIVEVGQVTTVNIPLTVGQASATVEVTAEAPVINTNSQDFATNINETSIRDLPINGRRASNFVLLTPATVPDGNFGLISFRGISGLLNNSTVDGGDNNQSFQSEERGRTRIGYVVSQAAIREFQVNTSNYSAEYGRSAGGVVNTVTKSGTNQFRGMLFEYYRNNKFGARNPASFVPAIVNGFSSQVGIKAVDVRHQFGGAIGGPIIKNRLFFFFSYDQQKRNFPGIARFSSLTYLNTADTALLTTPRGQQVPGRPAGTLGRGLTSAQVNETLGFLTSLTGETPRRGDQTTILPKIDWQINDKNLFSATYNRLRWESPAGLQTQATNTLGRRSFGDDFVDVDTLNLRLQSTISPNLLNEARFQYARDNEYALSQEPLPGEPATATTSQGQRSPQVALTNGLTFGTTSNFERLRYPFESRVQFADTVTWISGRHTFKFGGDINRVTDDIQNLNSEAGQFTYGNINDFIVDYVNFKSPFTATTSCITSTRTAGRCYTSNYVQGVGIPGLKFSMNEYSFFLQDDFRITPRLTINMGLRYEYQKLPDAIIPNASTAVIPRDGRTLAEATSTLPSDKNNFGPRVGFAYDLTGQGRTSLRAGYGIYYGRFLGGHVWNNLLRTGNPAGQGTVNIAPASGPIFPNVLPNNNQTLAAATINFYQENFQAPMIHQYDLVLEHEIAKNTAVSVSYIGSTGRYLPTFVEQNITPTGGSRTFNVYDGDFNGQSFTLPLYTRANTALPSLLQFQSSVKSQYHALVLQGNRRFTNGLQFQASYTLAKSTDTGQNSQITTSIFNQPLDLFNPNLEEGPSNFDIRHKFVASAVYSPTLYDGSDNAFYNYLLNGWSLAPIFIYYSGSPFTGSGPANLNGTNGSNRFPLNRRNSYRNPDLWNVDLRVSKRINFTERYNLELLAEGFNIFNRTQVSGLNFTQYANCPTTIDPNGLCFQPTFGSIFSTDSNNFRERQIQFAVRFHF
ncbi:MAG TPA: TonB-dependent receptor [Pyrinomonadaceae bacterium]